MSNEEAVNKGEYLKEKILNMLRFVSEGTGVWFDDFEKDITPVRAVLFCQEIHKHKLEVMHRNWVALHNTPGLPTYLQDTIVRVKKNPDLHDKFWRYMELFVEMGEIKTF
tara:strand:- start:2001 stop:2330 length:330 start_codon:yes stop_codon:yes gene_type:complete